ncbi:MAG: hypothetical protein Q6363_008930 [Candidatus Njordarchaeota archaeon]
MPMCIKCGKRKPTLASGWIQCKKCGAWYCPDCYKTLKIKPGLKNRRICMRCHSVIYTF